MRYADPRPSGAEAPVDYRIEDGVLIDGTEALRPNTRPFGDFTRAHVPTTLELKAEEMEWARRSGPVVIIRPAREVA